MKPYYEGRLTTIYCGDSTEIISSLDLKNSNVFILTDPPYGVGADKGVGGYGSSPNKAKKYTDEWDKRPPKAAFDIMLRVARKIIIFGGNFFADYLPVGTHWIVWDKKGSIEFKNPYGDVELAWTNLPQKSSKKYTFIQQGFVAEERNPVHPTQKPVALFARIIRDYASENDLIIDPYLGSGTTCVAANSLGYQSIGIEIEEKYCEISKYRVQNEQYKLSEFEGVFGEKT